MAFNLCQRIYPDPYASTADQNDSISPASCRLLAVKEGHIGVHLGPIEPGQDPLVGNPPGACPPGHPALPHHHYEMPDREAYLHDNAAHLGTCKPLPDPVYHSNSGFHYDRVPYHLGMNTGWYDPSGRGPEVQYGRYCPQFLLLPLFASCPYMTMYADNTTIHRQHETMGRSHYINSQLPLCSQHIAGYAEPSGGHESVPGGYREVPCYRTMSPGTAVPPSVEGGAKHSADIPGTHADDTAQPSEPLVHEAADK